MRTPEEMYDYCKKHNTGIGVNKWLTLQHFDIIAKDLTMYEEVLVCFVGTAEDKKHYACGLTKDRLILARRKIIGEFSKITLLNNVNDIRKKVNPVLGYLTFFTLQNSFTFKLSAEQANYIYPLILNLITKKEHQTFEGTKQVAEVTSNEPIEVSKVVEEEPPSPTFPIGYEGNLVSQLRELKQLVDEGILTNEEFETQKKKLLRN